MPLTIQNSTTWPAWFLRRVVSWCRRELGMPRSELRLAVFRNSRSAWGGNAQYWKKRIAVCVGHAGWFPRQNTHGGTFHDRLDCLVEITAHELAHLWQHLHHTKTRIRGGWGGSENATEWHALPVLAKFQRDREALLAQWFTAPVCARREPKLTVIEKRALQAERQLKQWQRKLKLAQTKVKKLRNKVRYYQRKKANENNAAPVHAAPGGLRECQPAPEGELLAAAPALAQQPVHGG